MPLHLGSALLSATPLDRHEHAGRVYRYAAAEALLEFSAVASALANQDAWRQSRWKADGDHDDLSKNGGPYPL